MRRLLGDGGSWRPQGCDQMKSVDPHSKEDFGFSEIFLQDRTFADRNGAALSHCYLFLEAFWG